MFVKIKMEPESSRALETLKDIRYISLKDDATITHLKLQIEQYVNIAAEKQEIRTLTTSFGNNRCLKELCSDRGTSIMLYAYNDYSYDNEDPRFICFLQIYSDESCLKIQEMELQHTSAMLKARENASKYCSSAATLIAVSETESSDSGSEDSDTDCSGNSDDFEILSGQRKRHNNMNENINQKRFKASPSLDKFSPTLCQFLDEFPKSQSQVNNSSCKSSSDESDESRTSVENSKKRNVNVDKESHISATSSTVIPCTSYEQNKEQQNLSIDSSSKEGKTIEAYSSPIKLASKELRENNNLRNGSATGKSPGYHPASSNNDILHPCYYINPETRQYALCIYKIEGHIQNSEFEKLLEWLFEKFKTSELPHQLDFQKKSPITCFDGKIWIACMNSETSDWALSILSQYNLRTYKVEKLCNADSNFCKVVIPKVVQNGMNNLLDTFKLLEKQNPNLSTLKWCIKDRRTLKDDDPEAVSAICHNELISLWVDQKSREFLEEPKKTIKYCFWEISFKFVKT